MLSKKDILSSFFGDLFSLLMAGCNMQSQHDRPIIIIYYCILLCIILIFGYFFSLLMAGCNMTHCQMFQKVESVLPAKI